MTFTILVLATLSTSAACAQYDGNRRNDNKYDNNNSHEVVNSFPTRGGGYDDRGDRYFSEREKNMQIAQINREYNYKIQSVKSHFFMSRFQKGRKIDALNFQRDREIHSVIEKFHHQGHNKRGYDGDRPNW
ncbi:MAG: hypothetical protein JWR61_4326 [Ferruginibacter sp.]|nr:hypothetical protein [Ferruginibacter sp.]